MKRVCVIDPVPTRYGLPVLSELSQHCAVDWIFSPSPPKSGFGVPMRAQTATLRFIEIPTLKPFGEKAGMFQCGIAKYILTAKPDAIKIFANPRYLSFWTTLLIARMRGIPIYTHGVGLFKKRRVRLARRLMTNLILRLATSYIAYAPIVLESFSKYGFSVKKVSLAHNSLINPHPVAPEEKTGAERGILFVGRLRPRSGLRLLLQVLARLHREGVSSLSPLHIVGTGEEAAELRHEARNYPWAIFHGNVDDAQVSRISRDCLLGCYPGNAGLSVVHLMSLSLPVIVHDDFASHEGPEPSYVRDGLNGILYDHRNPEESLYQVLCSVAKDPSRTVSMRRSAFQEYRSLVNPSFADRLRSILLDDANRVTEMGLSRHSSASERHKGKIESLVE